MRKKKKPTSPAASIPAAAIPSPPAPDDARARGVFERLRVRIERRHGLSVKGSKSADILARVRSHLENYTKPTKEEK